MTGDVTGISRRTMLQSGAAVALAAVGQEATGKVGRQSVTVKAPFDMPPIRRPDFSKAPTFPIDQFGARADDKARNALAIARAIDAANAAGGGTVLVPEGRWLTGKVHLRSGVNLHLAKGATLLFSPDPADYLPPVKTSWEGIECLNYSPLIYAYDCEDVAITGSGTLEADLAVWQHWYARPKAHLDGLIQLYEMARANVPLPDRNMTTGHINLRPHFIQFNRCRNILVDGIRVHNSPFWTIHPYMCSDVTIRNVQIFAHGHNNDGIDPEMSDNVLIEHCIFDQGDDAVSVKSGRDMEAWRIGKPARNIVMRHCTVRNGHQMMAIGSELSGGVQNIFVHDCHYVGDGKGGGDHAVPMNNILYIKTNERRGGFVRNIHMSDVTATKLAGGVLSIETDVLYQWKDLLPTYVRKLTPISDIDVAHVTVGQAGFACRISGEPDLPVHNVRLHDVHVARLEASPVSLTNVVGFRQD